MGVEELNYLLWKVLQSSASVIIEGLRSTLFAASADETKQVLTGCI